ncbi:MAG TPA: PQQ-binding-like beta-propeller repeat protein, partial [Chthoniobacteraceae bacterium]|nr:PQQ-binding-like beta-propeller repeat protein [Chthoniobacteraceae bacterium]
MCSPFSLFFLVAATSLLHADDWPQWLGPERDSVWREDGLLEKFPADGPVVRWRVPLGLGYTGPAVADGRVYVMDRRQADGAKAGNPFSRGEIPGTERLVCFAKGDGKLLWEHEYDCRYTVSYPAGPRAT